ncbi:p23 chaperone protein wos2 [Malassezia furfur]|uniref:P23 chaperone protein wos2 n=1 Tax=Malassezia furfur TaxID=55194 RepID=A0ABY8EUT5_MALFU|nr:SBA1 [Malassezia furfur]WFD49372.1 p23 chaperone protein wos2 [Malassezia furfur]
MSGTTAPEVLWAQRSSKDDPEKNLLFLTFNVPNLQEGDKTKLEITPTHLHFSATVPDDAAKGIQGNNYTFDIDFYDEVKAGEEKKHLTAKSLFVVLPKAKAAEEYWPRLTKDKVRLHNVKTDFQRWVDEDEQDEQPDMPDAGFPGMGAGGMPDMGGMGGMGGMDLQQMLAQMGGGAGSAGFPGADNMDGDEGDDAEDADAAAEQGDAASATTKE